MNEEEKKAVCELKNYITKRKRSYTKLDRHDKAINNLLNLIVNLQKENTEFEKLSKDYSYSVDIVRENTRLRRQAFNLELENKKLKNTELKQAKIKYLEIEILNEELQEKNKQLRTEVNSLEKEKAEYLRQLDLDYVDKNFIKKQEVENIINKLSKIKYEELKCETETLYSITARFDYERAQFAIKVLQGLLAMSELNSEFNSEGKSEV